MARSHSLSPPKLSLVKYPPAHGGSDQLMDHYCTALEAYLRSGRDEALQNGYEIGRQALAQGLSMLQLVSMHHDALSRVLMRLHGTEEGIVSLLAPRAAGGKSSADSLNPLDRERLAKAVERFLDESLTPFEVTHRGYRAADEALRASEERLREIFENANDMIFTSDLLGNLTSVNRVFEHITGYSRNEAKHMNFGEFLAPEYRELALGMSNHIITGETPVPHELEVLTKDGRRVFIEINFQPVCQDRKPIGMLAIARDITERKRSQDALHRLNDALENEARRIAHILHDEAAQLLASVHIALSSIAGRLPPEQSGSIQGVQGLLYKVEDQLRRLSHEIHPAILDDLGLVPALEFLAQGISTRAGIAIIVEDFGVGRLPDHIETALYRVTQEALTNAVKHSKAGSIRIKLKRVASEVCCSVTDDGVGFDLSAVLVRNGERGFGLINMMERLKSVGGSCIITSSRDHGTEILASVPSGG